MNRKFLLLMTTLIFTTSANADVWKKFICQGKEAKSITFIPDGEEKICVFFDGMNVWNLKKMIAEEERNYTTYNIELHSGCGSRINQLLTIKFSLPSDREKRFYQDGGYYIPNIVRVPFEASSKVEGFYKNGETVFSEEFFCHGIE